MSAPTPVDAGPGWSPFGGPVTAAMPAPPAAPQQPPADKRPEKSAETTHCRHCHWPASIDPVDPEPGEAQEFCNAVWRGRRHTRSVELFDGAAAMTFQVLSAAEEDATYATLQAERAAGKFPDPYPLCEVRAADRLASLRLPLALVWLRVGDRTWEPTPGQDPDAATAAIQDVCVSADLWNEVRWGYRAFAARTERIRANARNPSFFRATPAGGPSPRPQPPATQDSPPPPAPPPAPTTG